MKTKWLIVTAVMVAGLAGTYLWLPSHYRQPLRHLWLGPAQPMADFSPSLDTELHRAYCAKKIERVRVVHLMPGELHKPVTLGPRDPEFVRLARKTLDQFWHGEIVLVETNNGGALFPGSDREMTLALAEERNGNWRAFALLYDEPRLMSDLRSTASSDDSLLKSDEFRRHPDKNWRGSYYNKTGNLFWSVTYDRRTGEFLRPGDGTGAFPVLPRLFARSLQDVVAGRCDRLMSEAVNGPAAWKRPVTQIGEF